MRDGKNIWLFGGTTEPQVPKGNVKKKGVPEVSHERRRKVVTGERDFTPSLL